MLASSIESFLRPLLYDQITPHRAEAEISCPVFLVHGAVDDLIPPSESMRLHESIRPKSYLLISPFLTHTHPNDGKMTLWKRTVAAIEVFRFFYEFASVVR